MGRLYKKITTRYVSAAGKRCRKSDLGAQKIQTKSKKWWAEYRDAYGVLTSRPLARNKQVAQQQLNEIERLVERQQAGLANPVEDQAQRPLIDHIDDYICTLRAQGRTEEHCSTIASRIRRTVERCNWKRISDLAPSPIQRWLNGEQQSGRLSPQTVRHYIQAVKQFSRWLVADHRFDRDRLAHLQIDRGRKVEPVMVRRELAEAELHQLVAATQEGPVRSKLTGAERSMLYLVASSTGLRASELGSLTPTSFDFTDSSATVTIDAEHEKARRGATLPLASHVVEVLRPWIDSLDRVSRVWPGKWARYKQAAQFMKKDLAAARARWIADANDDHERKIREKSDFLKFITDAGRADFHALRHTFLSRLSRAGASPKVMQMMARHSTVTMTLERYTHADITDLSTAIEKLPPMKTTLNVCREVVEQPGSTSEDVVAGLVAGPDDIDWQLMTSVESTHPFVLASP